jgi:hypothetical protein
MNEANDLDVLKAIWHEAADSIAPGLYKRVARQTWRIRLYAAVEIAIAATFLIFSLRTALADPSPEMIVLAIGIWIVALTALIYSLSNRAGTWQPASQDTQEFLRLSLRRCQATLRGIRFGLYLLLVQTLLLAAWHVWYWSGRPVRPDLMTWLAAACLPLVFLIGLLIFRARQRKELASLEALREELR